MADRWVAASVGLFEQSHDLFPTATDPACRAFAWLDIIRLAQWKDKGGLQRGQLKYSQRFLSVRWFRSVGWVNRLLRDLAQNNRISRTRNPSHREREADIITICNYEQYQTVSGDTVNMNGYTTGITNGYTDGYKSVPDTKVPDTKKKTPATQGGAKVSETWVIQCVEAWKPHGYVSHPQLGGLFKPLVKEFGAGEVVRRFQLFSSNGKAQYGLGFFRSHFHDFDKGDPMLELSPLASPVFPDD